MHLKGTAANDIICVMLRTIAIMTTSINHPIKSVSPSTFLKISGMKVNKADSHKLRALTGHICKTDTLAKLTHLM